MPGIIIFIVLAVIVVAVIISNIQTEANAYPSKILSKNCRGRDTSKLSL